MKQTDAIFEHVRKRLYEVVPATAWLHEDEITRCEERKLSAFVQRAFSDALSKA
jgi:hypothetical protein